MTYKIVRKHCLKQFIENYKQDMISEFVRTYSQINSFKCQFVEEPISDAEFSFLLDSYRKDDGTYWYKGDKIAYSELLKILKEREQEFINITLLVSDEV